MRDIGTPINFPFCPAVCAVGGRREVEPAAARRHPVRPLTAVRRRHLLHPAQRHPPVQDGVGRVQPGVARPPPAVPRREGAGGRGGTQARLAGTQQAF